MIKETPDITETVEVFGFSTARDLVNQTLNYQDLTKVYSAYEEPNIPSGFEHIDRITKGFKRGEITTISTRPGNGKTAFLLSLVQNIAVLLERRVALFSPERSAVKVINRLIESNTSHSIEKIRQGLLREGEKAHTLSLIQPIASANLFIDDSTNLDAKEIAMRCHLVNQRHHADIILVDSPESYTAHILDPEARDAAAEEMILGLKNIAAELDIPIVCFNQLSKPVSMINGGFTPSTKELPVYLTENSETIMFIHRPEYFHVRNESLPKGTVEMIIGKLNGKVGSHIAHMKFIDSIDRFVNPED